MSREIEITSKLQRLSNKKNTVIWAIPTSISAPITKVVVNFSNSQANTNHLLIQHAFNHVLSDLTDDLQLDDVTTDNAVVYTFPTPKSASHILVTCTHPELIAGVQVFVSLQEAVIVEDTSSHVDLASISYGKPVHTKEDEEHAELLTDGSAITTWHAPSYPAYADVMLQAIYRLNRVQVYFPAKHQVRFRLYGSTDGNTFTRLADISTVTQLDGESICVDAEVAVLRLVVLSQSGDGDVQVHQIRAFGEKLSNIPVMASLPLVAHPVKVISLTNALNGLITRRLGATYCDWFEFALSPLPQQFTLTQSSDQHIKITGDSGVTIAAGLNYYLKHWCQVNLNQAGMGDQVRMPDQPPKLKTPIMRQTAAKYRYAYNFTTHSYTMAHWGKNEWQTELDWLALSGVNLVLDPTGHEAVWALFLRELGYSDQDIADEISAPTFAAWQWMGNINGIGGPMSFKWIQQRLDLARHNHAFMAAMGMQIVLPGYGGLLPDGFAERFPNCNVIPQGQWCSFSRPAMLATDDPAFDQLAAKFYTIQAELLGTTHFWAVDPFHEGGNAGDLSPQLVAERVLSAMLGHDSHAVWVVQSWQENPTPGLISGIHKFSKKHALVLDLYAEKTPQWLIDDPAVHGGSNFGDTPWLFCMLNNFGGRMGLSGHLDTLDTRYRDALVDGRSLYGVGITPEASLTNPLLFDFFFDMIWRKPGKLQPINLADWLTHYAQRRYGASVKASPDLIAWTRLVYKAAFNMRGQGAPESIINARPAHQIDTASTWGNAIIDYPKTQLELALQALQVAPKSCWNSFGFRVDLVSLAMQVVANAAQSSMDVWQGKPNTAQQAHFLKLITLVDQLACHVPNFTLSHWLEQAQAIAPTDDFSQDQFMLNARALITTWGGEPQANGGGLHDYSNRQWAGLTGTLYRQRWLRWLNEGQDLSASEWFAQEWQWVLDVSQPATTTQPLTALIAQVLELTNQEVTSNDSHDCN